MHQKLHVQTIVLAAFSSIHAKTLGYAMLKENTTTGNNCHLRMREINAPTMSVAFSSSGFSTATVFALRNDTIALSFEMAPLYSAFSNLCISMKTISVFVLFSVDARPKRIKINAQQRRGNPRLR